jgi:nucleotide-binding universal stress UspA family protein
MKVVIALDDSPYSAHVLDVVCRRHWPEDVEFKILHVLAPIDLGSWADEEMPQIQSEIKQRRMKHAEKFCADARHKMEKRIPDARVHFEIRQGSPKSEILKAATDWESSRILIGAHGHNVCPHNLMGSVSRAVAEQAPCSVEIVKVKSCTSTRHEGETKKETTVSHR